MAAQGFLLFSSSDFECNGSFGIGHIEDSVLEDVLQDADFSSGSEADLSVDSDEEFKLPSDEDLRFVPDEEEVMTDAMLCELANGPPELSFVHVSGPMVVRGSAPCDRCGCSSFPACRASSLKCGTCHCPFCGQHYSQAGVTTRSVCNNPNCTPSADAIFKFVCENL